MNIPNVILFQELIKQFPNHNEPTILEGEHFLFTLSNGTVACTIVKKCFHIGEPTMILGDSYIINNDSFRHVTTNYGSIHLKDIKYAYHLTIKEYEEILKPLRKCSLVLKGLLDKQEPFKGDFNSYRYIYTNNVFYGVKPQGLIKNENWNNESSKYGKARFVYYSDFCFSLVFPDYGGSWRYYPPKIGVDSKSGEMKCYAPGRLYSEYDYKELSFSTYRCALMAIKYALKNLDKNINEILVRKVI